MQTHMYTQTLAKHKVNTSKILKYRKKVAGVGVRSRYVWYCADSNN